MALADDDDGFAGRSDPSDDLLHIVVPDDLRELDAEVAAYRRELELARRHERRERRLRRFVPGWARRGLPSPVFTVVLLLIATTGLMLSVFAPVTRETHYALAQEPLARPSVQAPAVGALIPSVPLLPMASGQAQAIPVDSLNIRPAVFVLLPAKCDCSSLVSQIVGQANEPQPAVAVVLVSAGTDDSAFRLAGDSSAGLAVGVQDRDGRLASVYHADGSRPTLLLVHSDGTLATAPVVFHDGYRLEKDLLQLRT